ncbi:DNA-binding response regulator [bacterium]|nr:DNA-binding response regulator [bacterium]
MKVLIVDDIPDAVELVRMTLLQAGIISEQGDFRGAHSVSSARLEILRERPDLVILDEILPGESSRDLLHEPGLAGVPVILISAAVVASPGGSNEQIPGMGPRLLGRLAKWGWRDLDRMGGVLRRLILENP